MITTLFADSNLKAVFEALPSGVLLIDANLEIVRCNAVIRQLFGTALESPGPVRIGTLINCPNHRSDPQGCGYSEQCRSCGLMRSIRAALVDKAFSRGDETVVSLVTEGESRDIWFLFGVSPLSLDNHPFALVSFEDITERKQIENINRENEERYRQQFRQSMAVMIVVDPEDGAIVDANEAACSFYGYAPETLKSMNISDINTSPPEILAGCIQGIRDGSKRHFTARHRISSGALLDVEVFSNPVSSKGRQLLHSIVIDISMRLAAENELREKMDFAENLVQNSTTPTFVINSNHQVLIWNRALEELTGIRTKEVVGTNQQWRAFYPSPRPCLADIILYGNTDSTPELYNRFSRSRLISDGLHAEGDFLFDNRRCRLVFSAAPIRNRNGEVIAAIETLEDITERISLETQLLQAQKMESVGELAGGIAHDFNNVLTVISGYAELLQLTLPADGQNIFLVREISASVERAANMTRSLLAFSGKQEIARQHDDLNQILDSIGKSLARLIREDITLNLRPAAEKLPVNVDRVQIEQMLINLVVNARDVLDPGGVITVATLPAELEEPLVAGGQTVPPGRYACISVADNGKGMTAETRGQIFEPFFTTKERGKGTGLGLSIVHSIATRHEGSITVWSEPGRGSEFRVYLPLHTSGAAVNRTGPISTVSYQGTETVLVIEDDAAILTLHENVLSRYGYKVLTASDGIEAAEVFDARLDEIQLVITDVIMPRMNGREVVEHIRKKRPDLPIIMCSGYTDEIIDRDAIDELKVVFMQKPLRPLDLLAAIRGCLNSGK